MSTEQNQQNLASITFVKGPLSGKNFQIVKPTTTIGRLSNNDIVVPDQKVSNRHDLNYLLITWLALIATILILGVLTGYFLKRNDTHV